MYNMYTNYKNRMSSINIVNFPENVDAVFGFIPFRPVKTKIGLRTFGLGKMMLVFDFASEKE